MKKRKTRVKIVFHLASEENSMRRTVLDEIGEFFESTL